MDCKDCKNYEPGEKVELQQLAEELTDKLATFCGGKECDECVMRTRKKECVNILIKDLLRKAGACI